MKTMTSTDLTNLFKPLIGYPHVLVQIRAAWGTARLNEYVRSLIIVEDREHREGFPPQAVEALFCVLDLHEVLYPCFKKEAAPVFHFDV